VGGSISRDPEWPPASNTVSGSADDVIQARDVAGGVHFYGGRDRLRTPPRQLPAGTRVFVNRVEDLARLDLFLDGRADDERSVTLCVLAGTAGVGKTSLAVHWAHRVIDRFPDGQLYVNLHGYDPGPQVSPHQALERFLLALQVPAESIPADL
jgi:hypothetical protein